MIDPLSALIGVAIGVAIGFIIGKIGSIKIIDQLKSENERLYRDYSRVSTRGPGGRFIKTKD
jgi:membrane protein DedA with SNARE-associated domain